MIALQIAMRIEIKDGFYLSTVRDGDQAAYVEHFRDKETTDRLLKVPYPYTEKDAECWVGFQLAKMADQTNPHHFAIRRADGFLVGGIGLELQTGHARHRAELGYWIAKEYRGRGLVTATVTALLEYAFRDLQLRRIEATTFSHNAASQRVLEKAGFTREGLLLGYHLKDGNLIDACLYAILERPSPS